MPDARNTPDEMSCPLNELAEVLGCTHTATEFAIAHGFPERETWELTIAFSELASNVIRHGGGGRMRLEFVSAPEAGLIITAEDNGVGIENIEAAFTDDFSQGHMLSEDVSPEQREGLGSGLGAVKRLTDDVQVESIPGTGTKIRAFKRFPAPGGKARAVKPATPWLVLGLGNSILCDDGVGIKAARYIAELGPNPAIVVKEAELAGFALLDLLEGFERAVVIDAVKLRDGMPGEVVVFDSTSLEPSLHLVAGHQIDLPTALEMGRKLGRPVPTKVFIVGVQIQDDRTFDEHCTPEVEAAIPAAAHIALRIVAAGQ